MNIVNELNELAEKMTGINPQCTTDAEAVDYIEQNYGGGVKLELDANEMLTRYGSSITTGTPVKVEDETDLAKLQAIDTAIVKNNNAKVNVKFVYNGVTFNTTASYLGVVNGAFNQLMVELTDVTQNVKQTYLIAKNGDDYYVLITIYELTKMQNESTDVNY